MALLTVISYEERSYLYIELRSQVWRSVVAILVGSLLAAAYNILMFYLTLVTSALTNTILGNAKQARRAHVALLRWLEHAHPISCLCGFGASGARDPHCMLYTCRGVSGSRDHAAQLARSDWRLACHLHVSSARSSLLAAMRSFGIA